MKLRRLILLLLILVVSGCGNVEAVENAQQYITTIEELNIPDDVKVIGLGEATHGNVEFQQLKKDVMEVLAKNEGVQVFVLEGDFGAGQKINQFILSGKGTAKEAVFALDYEIYRTQEMIDLVQWMHDYNNKATNDEKVYFYGNDMQRYDASKQGLLDFYQPLSEEKMSQYEQKLSAVSNDTMRELTKEQLEQVMVTLDEIISDLQHNEESYSEQSTAEGYALALQYARVMKQRTNLFLTDNYTQLRDQYLAENLKWIVDYESSRGHSKILISGHNGHIEKTSANAAGYKSMGNYLDETYGDEYFAIGTDFLESEFQAKNGSSDKREIYKVSNKNQLLEVFRNVEGSIFYVNFEKATESEELSSIIATKHKMANIGDDFRSWYKFVKSFYTIEMTPEEAYDGIIIVKNATPTKVID
ncbi:erythromycin esterase family protein [Gracilibacillus xinjiangensis]|uniref:Erythromycin esterase family protein n=1 Tax=Gracilibacillus xinjiangensis TaxID=1193282 RepID=A0ABV8WT02_9BACI